MGRNSMPAHHYEGGKLYAQHMGGDGYYDRGGAYWGHSRVYAVYTKGGAFLAYVEATNKAQAIKQIQDESGLYHMPPLSRDGKPDKRYSFAREFCGRKNPQFVARFCGEFISAHKTKRGAYEAAHGYESSRI
jgi:hypothetical protein